MPYAVITFVRFSLCLPTRTNPGINLLSRAKNAVLPAGEEDKIMQPSRDRLPRRSLGGVG